MPISDLQIVDLLINLYSDQKAFDFISNVDEVCAGLKYYPDCTLVAFRGSTTFLDWLRDFQACMVQTDIGRVEMGFYVGLRATLGALTAGIPKDKPVIISGHSLGGGRAYLFAALLIKAGYNVRVVTFGAPRPGDAELKGILAPYSVNAYKNGNSFENQDFVTDVPLPIHPLLPYEHPRELIPVYAEPPADDNWGVLRFHHIQLYQKALASIPAPAI